MATTKEEEKPIMSDWRQQQILEEEAKWLESQKQEQEQEVKS